MIAFSRLRMRPGRGWACGRPSASAPVGMRIREGRDQAAVGRCGSIRLVRPIKRPSPTMPHRARGYRARRTARAWRRSALRPPAKASQRAQSPRQTASCSNGVAQIGEACGSFASPATVRRPAGCRAARAMRRPARLASRDRRSRGHAARGADRAAAPSRRPKSAGPERRPAGRSGVARARAERCRAGRRSSGLGRHGCRAAPERPAQAYRSRASASAVPRARLASGSTPWASRRKTGKPSQASSCRICWVTAPAVTPSSSAALTKLPQRAAASKARSALSEGRRGRGGLTGIACLTGVETSKGG
jgi:hypothetical protein